MIRSNFHTHTVFCDGKSTAREMVEQAIRLGFTSLGFSGHVGGHECLTTYSMSDKDHAAYLAEIAKLKEEYADRIKIYCGGELDLFSETDPTRYDYTIGSAHHIKKGDRYLSVDESAEIERRNVDTFYGDDFDAYCEDYFKAVVECVKRFSPTFIGHIDLCMKFAEINGRTETPRYLEAARAAITELCKFDIPFEINTGAISRGYRSTPYPSESLLRMIKSAGGRIMINSDCHHADWLDCAFVEAETLAKECGFDEYYILIDHGIESVKL